MPARPLTSPSERHASTTMMSLATAFLGGLLALGPAIAQDRTDYRRIPTEDGFLEVEAATGAVRSAAAAEAGSGAAVPSARSAFRSTLP